VFNKNFLGTAKFGRHCPRSLPRGYGPAGSPLLLDPRRNVYSLYVSNQNIDFRNTVYELLYCQLISTSSFGLDYRKKASVLSSPGTPLVGPGVE